MSLLVDIKKRLGDFVLEVNFNAENEIMGLLGASGCGKSMTLKCIAGIETPDEGRIVLGDRVLFDTGKKINLPPQQRKIGYLFQNYALFPNMTVEENIGAGVNRTKKEKTEIIRQKINTFFLSGLEKKRPWQLSGGQQQRVALARILASEPEILMLDEPFSALDSNLKWQLEQELMELLSNFPGTVVLVSHNRNEIYRFSDSIAVMTDGKVDIIGSKEELFSEPKTLSAALLTGCKNISGAEKIDEHSIKAVDWGIILYSTREVPDNITHVGMRAHYLKYSYNNDQPNTMNCQVVKVIENPFSYIIMLKNKNIDFGSAPGKIRWEVDKEIWDNISKNSLAVRLVFDQENLLLLT
ncbi:MAG: ABC-type sulfate/molybdate transport system, ATPase component [Eubacterium sp.]|jgi:molybdate transport system ATP-binding protein|nr:ABC-type sulfate/molybdate transport system, ATPase component [Eubacterium sp.]